MRQVPRPLFTSGKSEREDRGFKKNTGNAGPALSRNGFRDPERFKGRGRLHGEGIGKVASRRCSWIDPPGAGGHKKINPFSTGDAADGPTDGHADAGDALGLPTGL